MRKPRPWTPEEDERMEQLRVQYPGYTHSSPRGVRHPPPCGLSVVARELGRAKSSVHRRLHALAAREEE